MPVAAMSEVVRMLNDPTCLAASPPTAALPSTAAAPEKAPGWPWWRWLKVPADAAYKRFALPLEVPAAGSYSSCGSGGAETAS